MITITKLPQGRAARAALAAIVLVSGLLTGCALAATALEGVRWMSTGELLLSNS